MSDTFKILSLDGGGIRGALTAKILAEYESRCAKPLARYFDLIAGTSTGAILGIGIALGIPAKEILNLYSIKGAKMFLPRRFSLGGLMRPMYKSEALAEELKSVFGGKTIGDALTRLVIPSVEAISGQPTVFKTDHAPDLVRDFALPAWKVAMASSAAPVFFPGFSATEGDAKLDGGLWANNPALVGVTEGRRLGKSLLSMQVLSIGTGQQGMGVPPIVAKNAGYGSWSPVWLIRFLCGGLRAARESADIINLVLSVQAATTENHMKQVGVGKHERVNIALPQAGVRLDEVSRVPELVNLGDIAAKSSWPRVAGFFEREVAAWTPCGRR